MESLPSSLRAYVLWPSHWDLAVTAAFGKWGSFRV
jgi:hypothetical protein